MPWLNLFCPPLRSALSPAAGETTALVNLIDDRLNISNLEALNTWIVSNPSSSLRVSINNINDGLARFLGWESLNVREIVGSFAEDFLLNRTNPTIPALRSYVSLLQRTSSVGVHYRSGNVSGGGVDGITIPPSFDEISQKAVTSFPATSIFFISSDNLEAKQEIFNRISQKAPCVSMNQVPYHLERTPELESLEREAGAIYDWIALSNCSQAIIGTSGRYAKTAAYAAKLPFIEVPLSKWIQSWPTGVSYNSCIGQASGVVPAFDILKAKRLAYIERDGERSVIN